MEASALQQFKLQEWMADFAEQLKRRTEAVAAEVQQLSAQTRAVELNLENTFNSLRALSAIQFVENRVDEEDETTTSQPELQTRQPRAENYDSHIIPRYREAVLTAWNAFEGISGSKTRRASLLDADRELPKVGNPSISQRESVPRPQKLPYVIGTDEFARDSHCGLADFTFMGTNTRASSSEPADTDSDTDRDEARMAAEMVGGGTWLEGEWSASESETSGIQQQGGVLEPAVSAAMDFKAMLEAALRGPSLPYEDRMLPNTETAYGQYSYMDNTPTASAHAKRSDTPRTRSESGEIKLEWDLPAAAGQGLPSSNSQQDGSYLEHYMVYHDQERPPMSAGEADTADSSFRPSPEHTLRPPYPQGYGNLAKLAPLKKPITSPSLISRKSPGPSSPGERPPGISVPPHGEGSSGSDFGAQPTTTTVDTPSSSLTSLSLVLSNDEGGNPEQFQSQSRSVVGDNPPMPTVPDGLFQSLQAVMKARENNYQTNKGSVGEQAVKRPELAVKQSSTISAEKIVAGRLSISRPNAKKGTGGADITSSEAIVRSQVGAALRARLVTTERAVSFQGGLFDDEDDDDDGDDVDVDEDEDVIVYEPKDVLEKQKVITSKTAVENPSVPLSKPSIISGSLSRSELFDDLNESLIGPARALKPADEKRSHSEHPILSLPEAHEKLGNPITIRSEQDSGSDVHDTTLPVRITLSSSQVICESSVLEGMEKDMGPTSAEAAQQMSLQPRGPLPSELPSDFENMGVKTEHSRERGHVLSMGDLQVEFSPGSTSTTGTTVISAVNVNSSSSEQVEETVVSVGKPMLVESRADGDVRGNTSMLTAAITANRSSDSDDTSMSWSNTDSEELDEDNKEDIPKKIGEKGSTSSVTADNMADPSQQQSSFAASPSGSDDGKKKSLQSSWESDYKVSTLGIAIDMEINGKAAPSTYTRRSETVTSPLSRTMAPVSVLTASQTLGVDEDPLSQPTSRSETIFVPTVTNVEHLHLRPRLRKEHPSDHSSSPHSSSLNLPTNGLSSSSIQGVESSATVKDSPIQSGGSRETQKGFAAGIQTATLTARKYRSLFDDDDNEDDNIFLPRPQPQSPRPLFGASRQVGDSSRSNVLSNLNVPTGALMTSNMSSSAANYKQIGRVNAGPATTAIANGPALPLTSSEIRSPLSSSQPSARFNVAEKMPEPLVTGTKTLNQNNTTNLLPVALGTSSHIIETTASSPVANTSKEQNFPAPSSTAKIRQKSVSALLFGDEDDDGQDALFGPLGGQSRGKSSALFGTDDDTGGDSFLRNVSSKLPIASPLKSSKTILTSSRTSQRSTIDDDDHAS